MKWAALGSVKYQLKQVVKLIFLVKLIFVVKNFFSVKANKAISDN